MGGLVARRAVERLGPRLRGLPACRTVPLSASRPVRDREQHHAALVEHQRRWAEALPDSWFETVDSGHFIQAEQPGIVADQVRHLLDRAPRPERPTGLTPPCHPHLPPGGIPEADRPLGPL
ncbi:alpha/beta fold hydrolase [Kitasatospora aureofaciens]